MRCRLLPGPPSAGSLRVVGCPGSRRVRQLGVARFDFLGQVGRVEGTGLFDDAFHELPGGAVVGGFVD